MWQIELIWDTWWKPHEYSYLWTSTAHHGILCKVIFILENISKEALNKGLESWINFQFCILIKDASILYKMLKTNTFIIGMDLGYNIIGDEGATVLGQLLQVRTLLLHSEFWNECINKLKPYLWYICLKQDLFCQLGGQRLITTQFFAAP